MGGRSVKLTLEHDPRCASIELRRFDLVGVGSHAVATRTSCSGLQVRQMCFKASSGGLDISALKFNIYFQNFVGTFSKFFTTLEIFLHIFKI
jgi:hypothetical protein